MKTKTTTKQAAKKKTARAKTTKPSGHVLVRTYSAGVHFGELVRREGREVELANARRIWSWRGANTLNEIALRGVGSQSRVSERVASIVLTEAIEVLVCEPTAVANLAAAGWATS